MMSSGEIQISRNDYQKIVELLEESNFLRDEEGKRFGKTLKKARKVDIQDIPCDFVTMNSTINCMDIGTSQPLTLTLVFPHEADPRKGRISILSSVGTALLGAKIGGVVRWLNGNTEKYLQIKRIQRPA